MGFGTLQAGGLRWQRRWRGAVAMKLADQTQLSENLREALTSRVVIDQATGSIMVQQRCAAGEAFDILRRGSQNRNVKVRELAAEIVSQLSGQLPEPGAFHPAFLTPDPDSTA